VEIGTRTNEFETYQTYMRELSKIPLLRHQQEIELGRQVQFMLELLKRKKLLTVKLQRSPLHAEWAESAGLTMEELKKRLQAGERAKQKLITSNLRLVVSVAIKYESRGLDLLDLIQEGNIGLQRAVEKFDPTKGYRFSTYAYWWIRQGITRALATQGHSIRLPIHAIDTLNQVKKTRRELTHKLGYEPNLSEIARELKLDPNKIEEYISVKKELLSLNARIGKQDDKELIEVIIQPEIEEYNHLEVEFLLKSISQLLIDLKPQEREVLLWRFGLKDGEEKTLAAIGRMFNLSRERIRQLEEKGLRKIRSVTGQQRELLTEIQGILG